MWLKKFQEKIIESMMEDMQRISDDRSLSFPLLKPSQHLGSQKNTLMSSVTKSALNLSCITKCSAEKLVRTKNEKNEKKAKKN